MVSAGKPAAKKPDASEVQQKLTSVLAAGQQRLALVEQKNADLVKRLKQEVSDKLMSQGEALGASINAFLGNVTEAEQKLDNATKAGQAALDASKPGASDATEPSYPPEALVEAKASLGAKISVAGRTLRRAKSRKQVALEQAFSDAESRLDDEAMQLGTQLGDLEKQVEPVKQSLEDAKEQAEMTPEQKAAQKKAQEAAAKEMAADDPDAALMDVMNKDGFSGDGGAAKKPAPAAAAAPPPPAAKKEEKKPAAAAAPKKEEKKPPTVALKKEEKKPAAATPKKEEKKPEANFAQLAKAVDQATKDHAAVVKKATANLRATMDKDLKASKAAMDAIEKELITQRKKFTAEVAA